MAKKNIKTMASAVAVQDEQDALDRAVGITKQPEVQEDALTRALNEASASEDSKLLSMGDRLASSAVTEKPSLDPKEQKTQDKVERLLDPGLVGPTASQNAYKFDSALDNASSKEQENFLAPSLAATELARANPITPTYPEEQKFADATEKASIVGAKLQKLGSVPAHERANIGAMYGAGVGLQSNGPVGAVLGAAIGSMVGRGAGFAKSGELEDQKRTGVVRETLQSMKVLNKRGSFAFDDGGSFEIDESTKLKNVSSVTGKKDRTIYELDNTHPFTRRSIAVARPLAHFLTNGILKYADGKNPRDLKVLDNTTALMVNAMQNGTDSVSQVYERARQLAKRFGVTEKGMKEYFKSVKAQMPEDEAVQMEQGISTIFMGDKK